MHIHSFDEWHRLILFLDPGSELSSLESTVAGGMLKESDTTHWQSSNAEATNSSGFTALPGGGRGTFGAFGSAGTSGLRWTSTKVDTDNAWDRRLA